MAKKYISSLKSTAKILELAGDKTLLLDSPEVAWVVQEGTAQVYAVEFDNDLPQGRLIHIFEAEIGQTIFGINQKNNQRLTNQGLNLVVRGSMGTTLIRRERQALLKSARLKNNLMLAESAAYVVESWVINFKKGIIKTVPPTDFRPLASGEKIKLQLKTAYRPQEEIIWFQQKKGVSKLGSLEALTIKKTAKYHPLTEETFLMPLTAGEIITARTLDLIDLNQSDLKMPLWQALDYFHHNALKVIKENIEALEKKEKETLLQSMKKDSAYLSQAHQHLQKALDQEEVEKEEADDLLKVCQKVGSKLGLHLKKAPVWIVAQKDNQDVNEIINDIAIASEVRSRLVTLKNQWWNKDNGPLVVFAKDDHKPLALLQNQEGHNVLYNPRTKKTEKLNKNNAELIAEKAFMFYKPFSKNLSTFRELFKFSFETFAAKDLLMAILIGIAGGALGLIFPYITGYLFDEVIPQAALNQMLILIYFMVTAALVRFFFEVLRSLVVMRIIKRIDAGIGAALIDRLLKLPLSFFKKFSSGDLGYRALSFSTFFQLMSGIIANVFFNGVFSMMNLILMFYYSANLAIIALLLTMLSLIFIFFIGFKQYQLQKEVYDVKGKITGLLSQIFWGINRFRMAGAENRAYFLWAKLFGTQRKKEYKAKLASNILNTFSGVYPLLVSIIIFMSFYRLFQRGEMQMSVGIFLAFNAAFTAMLYSLMDLAKELVMAFNALPLMQRSKPILEAKAETDYIKHDPGELRGSVEVSGVSFSYNSQGPQILDNVSFKVEPGKMVAIVGSSGSGKSTLLKILLGFLTADSGTCYYDNQDLTQLDLRYLRSQLGVVLQNDQLWPGSIYENIVGANTISLQKVWAVAEASGLAKDIRKMPMGMQTYIAEGAATISGGQKQRILICRAIVKKPRIILFDEATSALDNYTQQQVQQSLQQLKATRIIIAHRLSTVVNADEILLLEKGKIIERGTYQELMAQKGRFSELARRQII